MSAMFELATEERDMKANLTAVRKSGRIPAVSYGPKAKSTSFSVDTVEFKKVLKEAGESSLVRLKGTTGNTDVLVHEVQYDPIRHEPVHVDFYVVEKDKKTQVEVPLEFVGVSAAVKDLGGILVKVLHEIEVEALPQDLPHNIVIDISPLVTIDSHITVADIPMPKGVTVLTKGEEVVALISEAAKEEEAPIVPIDLSAIEVEKKGKKEEEGGAEEEEK
jgi:large subunit ribosomal protein L25